jgi:hypothetical protein
VVVVPVYIHLLTPQEKVVDLVDLMLVQEMEVLSMQLLLIQH